jgi:uncharacterized membrane protein YdbT with pleckstrin-like domain
MGYPTKLLAQDESIAFELRPHWRSLIPPVLWLLVVVGVASFLFAKMGSWFDADSSTLTVMRWVVVVVAAFLLIFLFVRPLLAWLTTQYVFTTRRIIVRTGIIARRGRDMPLSKVNNVSFEHTVIERLFNSGRISVESASENGMLVIANVPNVEFVQREVYRLHDEDDAFRSARSEMYEAQFRAGETPMPLTRADEQARAQEQQRPTDPPGGTSSTSQ